MTFGLHGAASIICCSTVIEDGGRLFVPEHTHENAPTHHIQVAGVKIAYRRFGKPGASPLLLLNFFAANMDDWDPRITNGLAALREVIILDYPGVAGSGGQTPTTVPAMTNDLASFCNAINLKIFDVLGFSLGGMIAQQLALDHPDMVRRIILLGTGPRGGEGMTFTDLSIEDLDDPVALILHAFFTPSQISQAAGHAYLERIQLRKANRDAGVARQAAISQLEAIREFGVIPSENRFAMLGKIQHPALVVHGNKDVVVMPINAFLLAQHLPNAQLMMYPEASHGAQSQHAEVFLEHARLFLN
jgi:pimeloyl-ACP methyl ester carboxylesterase